MRAHLNRRLARHGLRRGLREGQRGMTLLEIMIVIAILGLLASVIVVAVMNQFDNAKIQTTKIKLKSLQQALHQYNVNVGDYPTQGEGLRALLNPPDGLKPMVESMPKDEWGNEILYFNPARKGSGPFEVVSKGPDGQEGTEDDIRAK
jgi:general secretion pathway protein G